MPSPIEAPAEAVKEVAGLFRELTAALREWVSGANIRHMKAAIEAGENYILTSWPLLVEKGQDTKALKELKERFFKYN